MHKQGFSIQHWQRPLTDLNPEEAPVTLLQVKSSFDELPDLLQLDEWLKKGNNLIILGVRQEVTETKFNTLQNSPLGNVLIDTRRRNLHPQESKTVLGDRFGAIIWEKTYGSGKVILAVTPHLAANAYQDYANFAYLARLVTQKSQKVLVDEYIHGYRDEDIEHQKNTDNLIGYLAKTPVFVSLLQVFFLLFIVILAQKNRFGQPVTINTVAIDNSQAYIQALATVLEKAESSNFVVEMISREEQIQLQRAIGLGQILLDRTALLQAWTEKTGLSTADLEYVLKLREREHRISEQELLSWLRKWQSLKGISTRHLYERDRIYTSETRKKT
jgi:hypothetical protein